MSLPTAPRCELAAAHDLDEEPTLPGEAPARDTLPSGPPVELEPAPLPFLAARYLTHGRPGAITCIVLHTTQNPCRSGVARNVAAMFARGDREASAHYVVGPDEVIQCVKESDKAWGAGAPVNDFAIHVEHTAFAEFTAEQWASPEADAMLRRSAALVAGICSREGIPVERLDAEALRAHPNGLAGHVDVSRAWHGTDHTDPGKSFPWDHYLALVEQAMTLP